MNRKRIAFVKFGGLATGGTEKWLQTIAANLPKNKFEVTYFYCNSAPYIGSDWIHPSTDNTRKEYLEKNEIKLVEFTVGAKDIRTPTHEWVDTNFWEVFKEEDFDLVCTGRAGHSEYPFYLMTKVPIVEFVTLAGMADNQSNIVKSIHISNFQIDAWANAGGNRAKAEVLPLFTELPTTETLGDLRSQLGLENKFVYGFHQRADRQIASPVSLEAYKQIENENTAFLLLGGDKVYSEIAEQLGLKNFIQLAHTGDVDAIHQFLNTLDVYAHARADGETFGHVLAEALYHGLPCVSHAARSMGHVETIGPAGVVTTNLASYVSFLKEMQENKASREQLSELAKKHFKEKLSLESAMFKLEAIIDNIFIEEEKKKQSPEEFWEGMEF
jgi:glycosyltransferase involved in cell wall biosynthesis